MPHADADVASIAEIAAVPQILEVVCRTTGLGFAAVARVTEHQWVACAVHDEIAFGLRPGGELQVETTICDEIRQSGQLVVIDQVSRDERYARHPTAVRYGFQSYISVPIRRADGRFFGTLCAIDPRPARLNTPEIIGMFTLFAELIAVHLDAHDRVHTLEALVQQRTVALDTANAELRQRIAAGDADRRILRSLTDRLERVREQERATLARELHDELGQALTAIRIDLKATRLSLSDRPRSRVRTLAVLSRMDEVVSSALDGVDRIVSDLRPAVLDALGCAAAAEWLVAQFGTRTSLRTRFESDSVIAVAEDVGAALFRILQEALTNISRHARASSVVVRLRLDQAQVQLVVADDGCGVSEADWHKPAAFGLRGMEERVRALGGVMAVLAPAGGGTELSIRVPASARASVTSEWTQAKTSVHAGTL